MAEIFDDSVVVRASSTGQDVIILAVERVRVGGGGQPALLLLRDAAGGVRFRADCETGRVAVKDAQGTTRFRVNGERGAVILRDENNVTRVRLSAEGGTLVIRDGNGQVVAELDGDGQLRLGGSGASGQLTMRRANGGQSLRIDGENANIFLGGNGADGDLSLFPATVTGSIGAREDPSIHLNGDTGDIVLTNADAAEEFELPEADVEPGDVVVIDEGHSLRRSTVEYDRKVAGVVAGAGSTRPALVLNRRRSNRTRRPVSLAGTTFCKVDARDDRIEVGDLLTTSNTPGHARVATDPDRTFGAVLGKALEPISDVRGLIPILVTLQ